MTSADIPCGSKLDQRGQAILRQQPLTHLSVVAAHSGSDDGPIVGLALLHELMNVPSLMGAVEISKTDMNNARRQLRTLIGRSADGRWEVCKPVLPQLDQRV